MVHQLAQRLSAGKASLKVGLGMDLCVGQSSNLCDCEIGPDLFVLDGEPGHQNVRHAQQRDKCGARMVQLGPPQPRP